MFDPCSGRTDDISAHKADRGPDRLGERTAIPPFYAPGALQASWGPSSSGMERCRRATCENVCCAPCAPGSLTHRRRVRQAAGRALWNVGPMAGTRDRRPQSRLNGADKSLRILAADTLLRIDPTSARPGVMAAMQPQPPDGSVDPARSLAARPGPGPCTGRRGDGGDARAPAPSRGSGDQTPGDERLDHPVYPEPDRLKPLLIKELSSDDGAPRGQRPRSTC